MPHPAVRPPRQDALRNRERVLDAAVELVRRDGEEVPMAQIAEHAGVGVGTVYRHFPTREDLLGGLVNRSFGLAIDNARAAAADPGSALEGVRAIFPGHPARPRALRASAHGGPVRCSPRPRASSRPRFARPSRTDRARTGRRRTARGPEARGPDRGRLAAFPATPGNRRLGASRSQADRPDDQRPCPRRALDHAPTRTLTAEPTCFAFGRTIPVATPTSLLRAVRGFWEMCSTCNCKSLKDCALFDDRYRRRRDDSATSRDPSCSPADRGGPGP